MLLTFSRDSFVELIKNGTKKHTIREDKTNRWKKGMTIHFWRGNPRNTKGKNKPYQFGLGKAERVEEIRMDFQNCSLDNPDMVFIGNDICLKSENELNALAQNDGFENWSQMRLWFNNPSGQFLGKIIFFGSSFSCA